MARPSCLAAALRWPTPPSPLPPTPPLLLTHLLGCNKGKSRSSFFPLLPSPPTPREGLVRWAERPSPPSFPPTLPTPPAGIVGPSRVVVGPRGLDALPRPLSPPPPYSPTRATLPDAAALAGLPAAGRPSPQCLPSPNPPHVSRPASPQPGLGLHRPPFSLATIPPSSPHLLACKLPRCPASAHPALPSPSKPHPPNSPPYVSPLTSWEASQLLPCTPPPFSLPWSCHIWVGKYLGTFGVDPG